jgi:hypothetical protein
MGGTATLLFSPCATTILCFNPVIDLRNNGFEYWFGSFGLPKKIKREFTNMILSRLKEYKGDIEMYLSKNEGYNQKLLSEFSNIEFNTNYDYFKSGPIVRYFRDNNLLLPMIVKHLSK